MYLAAGGSVISGNIISDNTNEVTGTKYGGGIGLAQFDGLSITNNIIFRNSASHGGGISLTYNDAQIINNTIVNNTASSNGGGIYTLNSNPFVLHTIVWGNEASNNPQISGIATVRYSDIQGGRSGEGNIDADPSFADTIYFYLSDSSTCIDAGDPNRKDPEDLQDPGSPLWPAMGTLRSDMGAYGGYELIDVMYNENANLPSEFILFQNYPNPFNPSTTIQFQIPNSQFTSLKIYDILGKEVSTLVSEKLNPGNHTYTFNGKNLASGVYYYQLVAGEYREVRKMVLIK